MAVRKGIKKHGFLAWARNMFLAGLLVSLPLVATIAVVGFLGRLLIRLVRPVLAQVDKATGKWLDATLFWKVQVIDLVVPAIIFAFLVVVILIAGIMATNVIGKKIVAAFESVVDGIPLVRFIYRSVRQAIDAFRTVGQQQSFKRVAFIEYPSPGCRLMGFVTGHIIDPDDGLARTAIFLPTSPNPMTGFVVLVEDDKVMNSSLSLEEATKFILSAGLVSPDPKTVL
ncbi:DUF502 domain-containing protein [Verrucomicrobiales bacterium]|nr:DUF502 domain-containing protein [Verrucomicrobiales bacterium]